MESVSLIYDRVYKDLTRVFALNFASSVIETMDHMNQVAPKIMWAAGYQT